MMVINASNKIYMFLEIILKGKYSTVFPYISIVSFRESFSPLQNDIHLVNSFVTLKTNHQTTDNLNMWLFISSEMTTVLNLNGISLLNFICIAILIIYDILVFCLDFRLYFGKLQCLVSCKS